MLVIRLSRTGRKNQAHYRLVAAEKSRAVQGKVVEYLGHYNPYSNELEVNEGALQKRLNDGAQPSSRAVKILLEHGVELPEWAKENLVHKESPPKHPPEEPGEGGASPQPAAAANTRAAEEE